MPDTVAIDRPLASIAGLENIAADFGDFEVLPIARELSRLFIDQIKIWHPAIQPDLRALILDEALNETDKNDVDLYHAALDVAKRYNLNTKEQAFLADYLAKLGYLIDVAGHIADTNVRAEFQRRTDEALESFNADDPDAVLPILRDDQVLRRSSESNLFPTERELRRQERERRQHPEQSLPPSIYELTVDEEIELQATPTLEDIATLHPNGSLILDAAIRIRRVHDKSINFARAPGAASWQALADEIEDFANPNFSLTPVVTPTADDPTDKNPIGKIRNNTVSEEGEATLHFMLENAIAMERLYARADEVRRKRYGSAYGLRQKMNLMLRRIFGTWSGVDIDGNDKKDAAFVLEKFISEDWASSVYQQHLLKILGEETDALAQATGDPAQLEWLKEINRIKNYWLELHIRASEILRIQHMEVQLHKNEAGDIILTPQQRREISAKAGSAFVPYGSLKDLSADFQKQTEALLNKARDYEFEPPPTLLSLYRSVKDSGISLGHGEPRENAKIFREVVARLLKDYRHPLLNGKTYKDLSKDGRLQVLNDLVAEDPGKLQLLARKPISRVAAAKELADCDPVDILVRNILGRIIHAHRNKGKVENILIAECEGADDIMAVFALQKLASAFVDDGDPPHLHICILPEDAETLSEAEATMEEALQQPAYRKHVNALGNIIKIMRPYSDNGARSGPIAAAGGLFNNHYRMQEKYGAVQDQKEEKEIYVKFPGQKGAGEKFTVQFHEGLGEADIMRGGGNDRGSRIWRYGSQLYSKGTIQGLSDFLNLLNISETLVGALENGFAYCAALIARRHKIYLSPIERFVIAAAMDTDKVFRERHLGDDARRFFASALIGAKISARTRNSVSRKVARVEKEDESVKYIDPTPVDLEKPRAIAKSKLRTEAFMLHSWAVTDVWLENMNRRYRENADNIQTHLLETARLLFPERPLSRHDLFDETNGLTALAYQTLYNDRKSPAFRCIADFTGDGTKRSDLKLLEESKQVEREAGLHGDVAAYRRLLHTEFIAAAKLTLQIHAQEQVPQDRTAFEPTAENCDRLRKVVIGHALPLEELATKQRYGAILHGFRHASIIGHNVITAKGDATKRDNVHWLRAWRAYGAGNDTVNYGKVAAANVPIREARNILRRERAEKLAA